MANPTRKQVLERALKEVGTKENPAGSNKTKYGKAYGLNAQPWCAIFVWWVIFSTHVWDKELKSAYTPDWKAWAEKRGWLKKFDADNPPKSAALMLWQMPGPKRINHIGIFVKAAKGGWYTIEGNTGGSDPRNGGMVGYQLRSWATLKAYCKYVVNLPYSDEQKKVPAPAPAKPSAPAVPTKPSKPAASKPKQYELKKVLKLGVGSKKKPDAAVKKLQTALNAAKLKDGKGNVIKLSVDGDFGEKTEAAVKKYQKAKKLVVTGKAGKPVAIALGWKWGGK